MGVVEQPKNPEVLAVLLAEKIDGARLQTQLKTIGGFSDNGLPVGQGGERRAFTEANFAMRRWYGEEVVRELGAQSIGRERILSSGGLVVGVADCYDNGLVIQQLPGGVLITFQNEGSLERGEGAVLFGSHPDTVPVAGELDGQAGCAAAMEVFLKVVKFALANKIRLDRPVGILLDDGEELMKLAFAGAKLHVGELDKPEMLDIVLDTGITLRAALEKWAQAFDAQGFKPENVLGHNYLKGFSPKCYVELHSCPDGLQLENGKAVMVAETVMGAYRFGVTLPGDKEAWEMGGHGFNINVTVDGETGHVASEVVDEVLSISFRRDALVGLLGCQEWLIALQAYANASNVCLSVLDFEVVGGAVNKIPGKIEFRIRAHADNREVVRKLLHNLKIIDHWGDRGDMSAHNPTACDRVSLTAKIDESGLPGDKPPMFKDMAEFRRLVYLAASVRSGVLMMNTGVGAADLSGAAFAATLSLVERAGTGVRCIFDVRDTSPDRAMTYLFLAALKMYASKYVGYEGSDLFDKEPFPGSEPAAVIGSGLREVVEELLGPDCWRLVKAGETAQVYRRYFETAMLFFRAGGPCHSVHESCDPADFTAGSNALLGVVAGRLFGPEKGQSYMDLEDKEAKSIKLIEKVITTIFSQRAAFVLTDSVSGVTIKSVGTWYQAYYYLLAKGRDFLVNQMMRDVGLFEQILTAPLPSEFVGGYIALLLGVQVGLLRRIKDGADLQSALADSIRVAEILEQEYFRPVASEAV